MKTYILYFSPTGRTYAAADAFTYAWASERVWVDMGTHELEPERLQFDPRAVCVVAAPCFSGHVPAFLAQRLSRIAGNSAPAVLVVTSSGLGVGNALCELRDTMQDAGFFVHAAMHAVSQHALCPEAGVGRPDEKDAYELGLFGQLVRDFPQLRDEPLILPGDTPDHSEGVVDNMVVRADFRCDECGVCVEACPVDAIPEPHPGRTDSNTCILCMQCAAVCPVGARHLSDVDTVLVRQRLAREGLLGRRAANTLYLRQLGALQEPEVSS